jgi:hypothetical protein
MMRRLFHRITAQFGVLNVGWTLFSNTFQIIVPPCEEN